ncbi:TPA: hypothetical protein PIU55_004684 [Klebsiella quasipneumoniae subsp. quasipneumoniae]|nr:hypothetical protein [Klebsiella quasipneumoniae subsp. quasipneumoniae]HBR5888923.1 hypothetical protein [Klebsiella pneumoniae]HDK6222313.1 hypothetical protein [Klebsiella quasipneumoniae]HDS9306045.1 hypothetical protein [Klebsiella quasipneumoniae subsp. similipneumoniae]HDH0192366.1 hypothetical protein [Klebsiella pneumoniae]
MTDANELPLSLAVAAANMHDIKLVADTLKTRQTVHMGQKLRLCSDKDYEAGRMSRRDESHIQSRNDGHKGFKAHH